MYLIILYFKKCTLSELCWGLVERKRSKRYCNKKKRLICLVLTLSVSTATTERAFSAMKLVKQLFATRWRMSL
ncbi:unnamed protein product [Prunus brigantina]